MTTCGFLACAVAASSSAAMAVRKRGQRMVHFLRFDWSILRSAGNGGMPFRLSVAAARRMVNRTRRDASSRNGAMNLRCLIAICALLIIAGHVPAQDYKPPEAILPDEATQRAIGERTRRLSNQIENMRRLGIRDPVFVDVEVYLKAAIWI